MIVSFIGVALIVATWIWFVSEWFEDVKNCPMNGPSKKHYVILTLAFIIGSILAVLGERL